MTLETGMGELGCVIEPVTAVAVQTWEPPPSQADSDDHLVALWLHGRSPRTLTSYTTEVRVFRAFLDGRALRQRAGLRPEVNLAALTPMNAVPADPPTRP